MPARTEKTLCTVIQQAGDELGQLIDKSLYLQTISQILHEHLHRPLNEHCQVANLQDNCLIIIAESAAWATQLRYLAPELIKQLQAIPDLKHVETLRVLVRPAFQPIANDPPRRYPRTQLSEKSARFIKETAECIADDALKQALLKLAGAE